MASMTNFYPGETVHCYLSSCASSSGGIVDPTALKFVVLPADDRNADAVDDRDGHRHYDRLERQLLRHHHAGHVAGRHLALPLDEHRQLSAHAMGRVPGHRTAEEHVMCALWLRGAEGIHRLDRHDARQHCGVGAGRRRARGAELLPPLDGVHRVRAVIRADALLPGRGHHRPALRRAVSRHARAPGACGSAPRTCSASRR